MISPYAGILTLTFASAGFLLFMIFISIFLGPRNKTATKDLPFECGSVSVGEARHQRFNVRFYLVATLFILFDVEVVFMYPWAVRLKELGWSGFYAVLTFTAVLALGLYYVLKKGVLNWND